MRLLLTREQMEIADRYTIETIGIPSMVLMERAAIAVVNVMKEEQMNLSQPLILCGAGNNGGDGFAIARILHQSGHHVTVAFVGDSSKMSEECHIQMSICKKLGLDIVHLFEESTEEVSLENDEKSTKIKPHFLFNDEKRYTVIIDGIFGIGLCRPLSEKYIQVIDTVNGMNCTKVAIDIPSGICADTGKVLGEGIKVDLTTAIQCEKRGTVLFPGKSYAGKVVTVDIGIETAYRKGYKSKRGNMLKSGHEDVPESGHTVFGNEDCCYAYEPSDVKVNIPKRWENSHKGTYGKVLVIAGSVGMSGAAYLTARATYGVGVGLVQIYTPEENRTVLQTLLPEAIITTYESEEFSLLEELLHWANVVCIGPGLGTSQKAEEILVHTLRNAKVPVVIDADGINLLKGHENLLKEAQYPCIITPHMKEMANFMDTTVAEIQGNPVECLKNFTRTYPTICVLKDSRTFIGKEQLPFFINTSGNNAMAKGGVGDVLAGVIAGFVAHKDTFTPYEAASFGVYLHGLGGDCARDQLGSNSVLARDIITGIEEVLAEWEKNGDTKKGV